MIRYPNIYLGLCGIGNGEPGFVEENNMGASDWIHLDFVLIVKETDKALLVQLKKPAKEIWIPLSQISDPDDYREGNTNGTISVKEWFATKEGLVR